ncbi:MAG: glycosyltransferase [Patescibacteria group bacterium]
MNIAHIIPHSVSFPLKSHNGRYEWVRQLALLQTQQGHTVTIYGSPASVVEGLSFAGIAESSDNKKQNNIDTFRLAFSNNHDVYHSHFDDLHYEVASETSKPIIFTQHWWPTEQTVQFAAILNPGNVWAVPPTRFMYDFDAQSGIQTQGFIYHGIDLDIFQPSNVQKNDRLLFVGRISPEKNLHVALSFAKKAGIGLDIVGKVAPKNEEYWQSLQSYVDGDQIRYLGAKNQTELIDLYSAALGVLCPYEPTEAFGLVAIESQACGTPIIMKSGGSRSELLQEGKTGFLCETEDEFIEAINKIGSLNAEDSIAFAKKFDIVAMAEAYEELYAKFV